MVGIYKITNIINNHSYIGKTNNSERRWKDHQRLAFSTEQKEYNKALYQAIRKYGLNNFSFEIIEEIPIEKYEELSGQREKYWISKYDTFHHGYNETEGGDGGSSKGHCQGTLNGRAKLTEEDVIFIRTKYAEGSSKQDCYKLFQNKISAGGFARVWTGQTWKHIMPEVFTEENKQRNASLGKSKGALKNRLFSEEEIKTIRNLRKEGKTISEIQKIFNKASINTIKDIVYNKTYKEVI